MNTLAQGNDDGNQQNTSDESLDDLIQQIAAEHDVLVSKDDPIMILRTMNERLIKDSRAAQKVLLNQFKSEMEVLTDQWSIEAKNHSDRILNASIASSKAEVARVMEEQSKIIIEKWKDELSTGFSEVHKTIQSSRQAAILNIKYCCFIHYFDCSRCCFICFSGVVIF